MNARSIIFFTRILARAQISSLTSEGFFIEFYRSQFWRLQKLLSMVCWGYLCFIGHNFGDYKNTRYGKRPRGAVLSVTILETTKTILGRWLLISVFYRSQFWRLQKPSCFNSWWSRRFIGHNFGDYKNTDYLSSCYKWVLSVTILETTKTRLILIVRQETFYRSQFWRLQKPRNTKVSHFASFIGHNFGDYKNLKWYQLMTPWRCAATRRAHTLRSKV